MMIMMMMMMMMMIMMIIMMIMMMMSASCVNLEASHLSRLSVSSSRLVIPAMSEAG